MREGRRGRGEGDKGGGREEEVGEKGKLLSYTYIYGENVFLC